MLKKLLLFPVFYVYCGAGYRTRFHISIMLFFKKNNYTRLANYTANRLQKIQGVFISPKAMFDASMELRHPVGVVIGEGVKVGRNVVVYQQVTLGGARLGDGRNNNYPEIGDNTVIFAGAVVVGRIKIGKNCTIGANSVVTKDVPDNCTAVGAPARIILNEG